MLYKPKKIKCTILGGLIIGITTGLPVLAQLNTCCCCGGVALCGLFSLYLYKKEFRDEMAPLESSDALIVGVVAGLYGAVFSVLISMLSYLIFGPVTEKFLINLLETMKMNKNLPYEILEWIDRLIFSFEKSIEQGITISWILFNTFFNVILYPIFSMVGALIGYGLFGFRK